MQEKKEYQIVAAQEQDIKKVAWLYDSVLEWEVGKENFSGWEPGEYPQEWTARELFRDGGLYCIFDGEKVIASAGYDSRYDDCFERINWSRDISAEQTLVIHTLTVHPDYRRLGLGEKLMRFGFQLVRDRGLKGVRIDTNAGNLPALRLYQRLGYTEAGRLSDNVHYDGDRMTYVFLEWYTEE